MTDHPITGSVRADRPPPAPPVTVTAANGYRVSAATRHLCAGAYLDETFSRLSLTEVYHQPRRAVAPSFGFDAGAVLGHCLRAARIVLVRDAVLVAVLAAVACASPLGFGLGLIALSGLYGLVAVARLMAGAARSIGAGEPVTAGQTVHDLVAGALGGILVSIGLGAVLPALGAPTLGAALSGGPAPGSLAGTLLGAGLTVVAGIGAPAATAAIQWHHAVRHGPDAVPAALVPDPRLHDIQRGQLGNRTVYSGCSPFVGSGVTLATDGMALRLLRPDHGPAERTGPAEREYATPPFTAVELVGQVRHRMGTLVAAQAPERRVPGLTVTDRVCTSAREVPWPVTPAGPELVSCIIRDPGDANRHYLACQVTSSGGELVTSVYVHCALVGRGLYLELTTCVLAPSRGAYRVVDDLCSQGGLPYLSAAGRGLLRSPAVVAGAPVNLLRSGVRWVARQSHPAQPGDDPAPGRDHGARVSIRELATPDEPGGDLPRHDVARCRRILTGRVLAAVRDFLVERGVDVTEFDRRGRVLIDNIGSGGVVRRVGDGADPFGKSAP
jgi:hypothetical protein